MIVTPNWASAGYSVVRICVRNADLEISYGQGVAVSSKYVLTALHGRGDPALEYEVAAMAGTKKKCVLVREWFTANRCDIALMRLKDSRDTFINWLEVRRSVAVLDETIAVLSLIDGLGGGVGLSCQRSTIHMVDPDTCICRAQYYCSDGYSGSGVVASSQVDGSIKVIGVHCASHDDTVSPPAVTKAKRGGGADVDSVSSNSQSLAKSLHGHTAYSMICVAGLVPELMNFLS